MRIHLQQKLLLFFLMITLASILAMGWWDYIAARDMLVEGASGHLTAVREGKKQIIRAYFQTLRSQAATLAINPVVSQALTESFEAMVQVIDMEQDNKIIEGVKQFYEQQILPELNRHREKPYSLTELLPIDRETLYWQDRYLVQNPYPRGAREKWMQSGVLRYDAIHARHHPFFVDITRHFRLEDVLLVEGEKGTIVYSAMKQPDFASNLKEGPYRQTTLAKVFRQALAASSADEVKMVDFDFYPANNGIPSAFVAAPIIREGKTLGVIILEIAIRDLNRVMSGHQSWVDEGLGESGETLLIGSDYTLRNESRRWIEDAAGVIDDWQQMGLPRQKIAEIERQDTVILHQRMESKAVELALAGYSGVGVFKNNRGDEELMAYAPAEIPGVRWAVIARQEAKEAFATADRYGRLQWWSAAAILLFAVVAEWIFSHFAMGPLKKLVAAVHSWRKRAANELFPGSDSFDETGELARSLNEMVDDFDDMKHARHRLEKILHTLPEILIIAEQKGDHALVITFMNAMAQDKLELAEHAWHGRAVGDLFVAEEQAHWQQELDELWQTGILSSRQKQLLGKNGQGFAVLFFASVVPDELQLPKQVLLVAASLSFANE